MKRAELEGILKNELKGIHFQGSDWTFERVVDAMTVVYNKGINDSVKNLGRAYYVRDKLKALKIK